VFAAVITKVKLPFCLINQALRHEDIWRGAYVASFFFSFFFFFTSALVGGHCSASHLMGPRAGLDAVEKRKFLLSKLKLFAKSIQA
jgi:hypothetical protein